MTDEKTKKARERLRDEIMEEEKKGNIVVYTMEGCFSLNLEEALKQPADGLLYDLNRDKVTVSSFLDDPKWVNDYAVATVITKLKEYYDKYMELTNGDNCS